MYTVTSSGGDSRGAEVVIINSRPAATLRSNSRAVVSPR